jgi:hypothetical protein
MMCTIPGTGAGGGFNSLASYYVDSL